MGGCFSDVKGGKQAVIAGGTQQQQQHGVCGAAHNDAVDLFFKTKALDALFTQLELSFSASKLRDCDFMSKSDPMVVVFEKKSDGSFFELGRTEVIMNNLDPIWIGKIPVAYQFETVQSLHFQVYDVDTKYHNVAPKTLILKNQDFLGEANCVLSEIVTTKSRSKTLNLHNNHGPGLKNYGTITVHVEETVASRNAVEVAFRCTRLDNKDFFSKSDPFLRISRIIETGGSVPICKTGVVNNNLNPSWPPLCLTTQQYASKDNPLLIECFDFNSNGDHILIGKLQKSVSDFERLHKEKVGQNFILPSRHDFDFNSNGDHILIGKLQKSVSDFERLHKEKVGQNFILPSRHKGREKVLKGQLFVDSFVEKQLYSFIDYISSGFELNFMVAVDFTASNGDPRYPDSLHYVDPSGRLNAYQQAIMEVGEVIQFYDSDRLFPAWGFGGKTFDGVISHCFNLNGSPNGVEVEGVEGIMAAYAKALNNVSLAGPTLFGQVINKAAELASQSASYDYRKYFVLLIITDGVLTDLQETTDAIVRACDLPLSVLIVGVGNADFKQMEILDADNGHSLKSSNGRIATRDIVQFVPMREMHGGQISVVQSLLEELPGQFLTHMRSRNIKPIGAHAGAD